MVTAMKVNLEVHPACAPVQRGIATYCVNLTRALIHRGQNDYVLTYYDKNKERNNAEHIKTNLGQFGENAKVTFNECNSVSYGDLHSANTSEVKSLCYNDYTGVEADIFHFFHACPIPTNLRGNAVVTIHDMIPFAYPEYTDAYTAHSFLFGLKRLKQLHPYIIAVSEHTKRDIIEYLEIPGDRIFVTYEGFDPTVCFPERNYDVLASLGIDCGYLLYFGPTDDTRKRIADVMAAFSVIAEKYPDIKLVIAGTRSVPESTIFNAISDAKIRERIIDLGFVTTEQRRVLLSSALAFIFPSLYEGFGLPVLETMACGSPVITANVSSLPEVGGGAVLYTEPQNIGQLVQCIERLLSSDAIRDEYRQRGFEQSKKFSWDRTAALTEEVYRLANNC
jgi:glycosyltransferase involved in cell wall biosynthesis